MYANDFVFSSTKKSKMQTCKPEPVSKQVVLSMSDSRKALLENETTDSNSEKAHHGADSAAKNEKHKKLLHETDLAVAEGRSCDAKKRGRKPKHYSDISLKVAENTKSETVASNLNLSPRGASLKLGEKASNSRGRKRHSANISLPYDDVRTSSANSEVSLTVPRKRGRPPKKPAGEISLKTDIEDPKYNRENSLTENSNISSGVLTPIYKFSTNVPSSPDEPTRTDSEFCCVDTRLPLSGRRKRGRPPKKLSGDNFAKACVEDAQKQKANSSSETTEATSATPVVARKRGQPPKKLSADVRKITRTCGDDADAEGLVNVID